MRVNSHGRIPLKVLIPFLKGVAQTEEVKSWRELLPIFSDMINLSDASIWIMGAIFFLAAALGVLNTMLMATYERIHELGLLKALGTSPWRIVADIASEALILAVLASLLGVVLGVGVSYYFQVVGLDTSQFVKGTASMGGVAFDPVWRAALSLRVVVWPMVTMWVVCLFASLYPAIVAARLDPVKAMQHV